MYEYLKDRAKINRRQTSSEINNILYDLSTNKLAYDNNSSAIPTEINGRKVKNIVFAGEKVEQILTPEEEELKQQKLQRQKDKILEEREKKWFRRTKEVLGEYWSDERCHTFAKDCVYGNCIWQNWPDDDAAVPPEEDDTNMDAVIKQALEDIKRNEAREEEEFKQSVIDDRINKREVAAEQRDYNKYYEKVHDYYKYELKDMNSWDDLMLHIENGVTDETINYIKDYHMMNIYYALDIPVTHNLTNDEWRELLKDISN